MALIEVARALRQHWRAASVTFVLIAVATLLALPLTGQRYEATAVVSIQPAREGVSTQLLNFLIPSIEERVNGSSLRADVAQQLPADARQSGWGVTTAVPPGSGVLRITVDSKDARVPVAAANAYALVLAKDKGGSDAVAVVVLDAASRVSTTSSRATILVSGLGLAAIIAVLVAIAAHAVRMAAGAARGRAGPAVTGTASRTPPARRHSSLPPVRQSTDHPAEIGTTRQ